MPRERESGCTAEEELTSVVQERLAAAELEQQQRRQAQVLAAQMTKLTEQHMRRPLDPASLAPHRSRSDISPRTARELCLACAAFDGRGSRVAHRTQSRCM